MFKCFKKIFRLALEEYLSDPEIPALYLYKSTDGVTASHSLPQVKKKCIYFLKEKQYCSDLLQNNIKFTAENFQENVCI